MVYEKNVQCKVNNFKTLGIKGISIEACISLGLCFDDISKMFLDMLVRCFYLMLVGFWYLSIESC